MRRKYFFFILKRGFLLISFQPIDSKRDEFRKFLERAGLIDLVSKCFIKLYEETEKPENPIEYFRENIGDALKEKMKIKMLQAELEEAKKEIEDLRKKIKKDDEIDSINKSTDSDIIVDDVVVMEAKTIETTPEKIEVDEKEKDISPIKSEEIKPEAVVEDEKEKEKENDEVIAVEKKDDPMEIVESIKLDDVEDVKPELSTKVELVEETDSSKVAPVVPIAVTATTESDPNPKPEEVTKEESS